MKLSVLRMLLRPTPGSMGVLALPVIAFAVVTALILTVIGGAQAFWSWTDEYAMLYQSLAAIAVVLLVVPLSTLGAAAARLSARRRDEKLSTLRLLGVTAWGVGVLTVIESTLIALTGVLAGVLGSLALLPAVALIPFRGEPLGIEAIALSPMIILAVAGSIVVLAAVSAIIALRQVVISPLGVRMRATTGSVHWIRAVIVVALLAAAFLTIKLAPSVVSSAIMLIVVLAGVFGVSLAVLNVIGPWVLKVIANGQARRAATPERLLAARMVLDSPKAAWRQVSGIAMASFMAVFAGTGAALMSSMASDTATAADLALATDIRTGVIITLVGSFVMVAASVGVTQASEILDQRPLHSSLHYLGTPMQTVDAARRRAIMSPLLITALGSALCAGVLVFPLLGIAMITAPISLLTIATVVTAGIGMVWLSTRVTRPLLARSFATA
ncbi:hypothetical protein JOD62_000199 [Microbacterium keratanolyticum]|uniref:Permease n=1 Tax=Microbacterium keratanolyticum TaxID=67574 RepID=A0A9W6HU46_9MICO|nr:FtsX-like permease family protein [Microbacterium keratanolyticum]MBM7467651.1 hypothetical protein [Microbacterium keratanolyticum]GLK02643.1 permease [Microbacterium keratanolyticum]